MFYLGVDGGGTKTTAVMTDEKGTMLRTVHKGAGNVAILDRGSLAELIRSLLSTLFHRDELRELAGAVFAFAGAGRKSEKEGAAAIIRGAGVKHFSILTDAEILHYATFEEQPGILLSSGTGSVCLVRDESGNYHQIGGWGYILGDEGSGYDIGNRAIRFSLIELQREKFPSPLTREIMSFYGIDNADELISLVYASVMPSNLIASCAKIVCDLAAETIPEAIEIVDEAVNALVNMLQKSLQFYRSPVGESSRIALAGGILKHNPIVRDKLLAAIEKLGINFQIVQPQMEPAAAGVLLAFRKNGKTVSPELLQKLKNIQFSH